MHRSSILKSFSASVAIVCITCCSGPIAQQAALLKQETTADHQLLVPPEPKALLVLFPCYSCDAQDTRDESRITDEAVANNVAVLLMDLNRHLFLSEAETNALLDTIAAIDRTHELAGTPVFFGGFSSGGNVAVLLAKQLKRMPRKDILLSGLFVVDSPLDLSQLYPIWTKHAEHSLVPVSRKESAMVIALLDSTLGNPIDSAANYEAFSPVTTSAASIAPLKDLPVRLYTEPDTVWWRIDRGDRYEDMNACYLEKLHAQLVVIGNARAEFITTYGRGIQHGHRHPHAWSIVDEKELVKWIIREQH